MVLGPRIEAMRRVAGELIRYGSVGVFSFALGAGISALLREVFGVPEEVAVAVSLVVLLITNFWLSRRFVFRAGGDSRAQFFKFGATALVMRGAEYAMFLALLNGARLNYLVALTISLVISNGFKFFLYRLVFRRAAARSE